MSLPASRVNHGAVARSSRSGFISPPTTAVSWFSRGHSTASPRKKPVMAKTWSSSVSLRHDSSAPSVPMGLIGAKTGSIVRPLMPPRLLRSSITALNAAS